MALLSLQNITLNYGGAPLLDSVSLQIERGERVCLLGRNGAGKSSLMRIIGGDLVPDDGTLVLQSGTTVARLPQEVPPEIGGTVYEVVDGGAGAHTAQHQIDAIISRLKLEPDTPFA